jgi:hypothetical protein
MFLWDWTRAENALFHNGSNVTGSAPESIGIGAQHTASCAGEPCALCLGGRPQKMR